MRKIRNEALTDWIIHQHEYDWNGARRWLQRSHDPSRICHNDVWRKLDQFRHILLNRLRVGPDKSIVDLNIAPFDPSQIAHTQPECLEAAYRFGVMLGEAKQHAGPPDSVCVLRPRRKGTR